VVITIPLEGRVKVAVRATTLGDENRIRTYIAGNTALARIVHEACELRDAA
jgi:hypothetical protein